MAMTGLMTLANDTEWLNSRASGWRNRTQGPRWPRRTSICPAQQAAPGLLVQLGRNPAAQVPENRGRSLHREGGVLFMPVPVLPTSHGNGPVALSLPPKRQSLLWSPGPGYTALTLHRWPSERLRPAGYFGAPMPERLLPYRRAKFGAFPAACGNRPK